MNYNKLVSALSMALIIIVSVTPELGSVLGIDPKVTGAVMLVCSVIIRQLGIALPSKNEKAMLEREIK